MDFEPFMRAWELKMGVEAKVLFSEMLFDLKYINDWLF